MAVSATSNTTTAAADVFASLNGTSAAATTTKNDEASADRFLKLLVAQMENQDPLNPMDNAQVTSQMAQINTVDGINRLNTNVSSLKDTFVQLQAMQGAALLGKDVSLPGDQLAVRGDGSTAVGLGGYELSTKADAVRLEVLNASGRVIDTQVLGPKAAGSYDFEWEGGNLASSQDGLRFRIVATQGTEAVTAKPIMLDRVLSVSTGGDALKLELENSGHVNYADVRSVRQAS
jgi:flagellar basal-body rod modification protein FlgD